MMIFTYSKFYYIYDDARQQKQDFVKRFRDMYTYLKKDKLTLAAGREHRGKQPPTLATCEPVGHDYIACDKQGANWLYKRL